MSMGRLRCPLTPLNVYAPIRIRVVPDRISRIAGRSSISDPPMHFYAMPHRLLIDATAIRRGDWATAPESPYAPICASLRLAAIGWRSPADA